MFPQLDADSEARAAVIASNGRAFSAGGDFDYLDELTTDDFPRTSSGKGAEGFASGTGARGWRSPHPTNEAKE